MLKIRMLANNFDFEIGEYEISKEGKLNFNLFEFIIKWNTEEFGVRTRQVYPQSTSIKKIAKLVNWTEKIRNVRRGIFEEMDDKNEIEFTALFKDGRAFLARADRDAFDELIKLGA